MYCIRCGVQLADTERACPLCGTAVCHPDFPKEQVTPLYPNKKALRVQKHSKVFQGAMIFLFLLPMLICFLSDLLPDWRLQWFGFAAGGLLVAYTVLVLPFWFRRPNPVVFVPCGFASAALYLLYIDLAVGGSWFLRFAFPITAVLGLIVTAAVTLLHYLKKGHLFIWGGTCIALGLFILFLEFLLRVSFQIAFRGWSVYPLIVLTLVGGMLIYLAINAAAREIMERKLFF